MTTVGLKLGRLFRFHVGERHHDHAIAGLCHPRDRTVEFDLSAPLLSLITYVSARCPLSTFATSTFS